MIMLTARDGDVCGVGVFSSRGDRCRSSERKIGFKKFVAVGLK
jgi:hypothetical protein